MCYNNHYCSCEVVDNQMYGSLNCLQVKIDHAFGKLFNLCVYVTLYPAGSQYLCLLFGTFLSRCNW